MDAFRHYLALIILVAVPAAFCPWLIIHPFAAFWRRAGAGWAYATSGATSAMVGLALFLVREPLLARDFGTSWMLILLAAPLIAVAARMSWELRKVLPLFVLVGLPELDPGRHPTPLLTQGSYARMRHPRYVQATIGLVALALVANHAASYLVVAVLLPALYVTVIAEERELRGRFGEAYARYAAEVPRFIPHLRRPDRGPRAGGRPVGQPD